MTGQCLQVADGGYSQLEPEWIDKVERLLTSKGVS